MHDYIDRPNEIVRLRGMAEWFRNLEPLFPANKRSQEDVASAYEAERDSESEMTNPIYSLLIIIYCTLCLLTRVLSNMKSAISTVTPGPT